MKPLAFHGSGQGSGDGSTRWGHITDLITIVYNLTCFITCIYSLISDTCFKAGARMFVDDTSLTIISSTVNTLRQKLEHNMHKWEKLLDATGGKLEVPKCKLTVMTLVLWLIIGFFAGALAKAIVPKLDKNNWFFAFLIAITGAMAGGFATAISGVSGNYLVNCLIALAGATVVLFFYRQYLSDVAN